MKNKIYQIGIIILLLVTVLIGGVNSHTYFMSMEQKRTHFISLKEDIQDHHRQNHQYRCCLEKPCTYCIEKTPGHGENATCDCLKDVVEGVHPCGECIGEILEGHGNPYLAEYFAKAIAEKTKEELAIKRIIEEKYGIPIENQV
jgi:hypothetical protein